MVFVNIVLKICSSKNYLETILGNSQIQFIKPREIGWAFGTYYKALDKWDFLEVIS